MYKDVSTKAIKDNQKTTLKLIQVITITANDIHQIDNSDVTFIMICICLCP